MTDLEQTWQDPVALNNLANQAKFIGEFDKARELFDRAIELRPNYAIAHYNRSSITDFQSLEDAKELESFLQNNQNLEDRVYLLFALVKV